MPDNIALPNIPRPLAISYAHKDFWITYRIARALGMGRSPLKDQKGEMGDIWFQFPHPELIPPYEELDIYCHVPEAVGHWGLDIIPAFICNSQALVVILSRHSAHSKQVHLEIDTYPDSRPVWFISIAGEPLPDKWKARRNTRVVTPPIQLDLTSMFRKACSMANEASEKNLLRKSYLFYWDAINLLALINPRDFSKAYQLFALKGLCEIRLGLGRGAVQSLESALILADALPQELDNIATNDHTNELVMLGGQPPCAMRAAALVDLGRAHMIARSERTTDTSDLYGLPLSEFEESVMVDATERKPNLDPAAYAQHTQAAQNCWRECLDILEKRSALLTHLFQFPYEDLKQECMRYLALSQSEKLDDGSRRTI